MTINKIHNNVIPLATRFEYGRKRKIIKGGTKKKKILETLRTTIQMNPSHNLFPCVKKKEIERKHSFEPSNRLKNSKQDENKPNEHALVKTGRI